jgi:small ligand-binding sensory domain FIST
MSADPSSPPVAVAASAVSEHLDTRTAATEVAHCLHDEIGGACDLVIVFASFHHRAALPEAVETIRQTINPSTTLAVTAEGVLGVAVELEGVAGMSALAMQLPGVTLTPWMTTPDDPIPIARGDVIAERIGLNEDFRAAIMLGEPFTTPMTRLLPALTGCGGPGRPVPIVGGMASGANQPGHNVLVLDDRAISAGAIGVSVSGDVEIDFVVSQGCRPVGEAFVVTKAQGNVILELGGRPALEHLREMMEELPESERDLLQQGLLIGNVIDEQRAHHGRGDFLVRNVLGLDRDSNGIAVGDLPRLGQTVQFHVRDAVTAAEDLQLLLDAQVIKEKAFGGLLFTCNGRGQRLFGEPNHDLGIILDRLSNLPVAGFFAAGEMGPIGDTSFVHGHTASLALFR